jgi:hypothetical protein
MLSCLFSVQVKTVQALGGAETHFMPFESLNGIYCVPFRLVPVWTPTKGAIIRYFLLQYFQNGAFLETWSPPMIR